MARSGVQAIALLLLLSSSARAADSQIRPFIGATFGGDTTFVDFDRAAGKPNITFGVTAAWLGEVFGFDVDFADAPGFFQSGDQSLILSSRVTTLTGNIVVAAPRRLTEYALRPYFSGGGGLMRVRIDDSFHLLPISEVMPGFDVGGGAIGFLTNRVGIGWELRRFQTVGRVQDPAISLGGARLSFWRATMALTYRY
jgi:hypothetical protein